MIDLTTFIEALKFVSHAAGVKDVRYYLNGVLFEIRPTTTTLIATDGSRMAIVEMVGEFGDVFADICVSNADIKTLLALYKPAKGDLTFTVVGQVLSLDATNCRAFQATGVECKFPDWHRVMPAGDPVPTASIGVNPVFIAEATKAISRLTERQPRITIELRGSSNCLWIEPEISGQFSAITRCGVLIMPYRVK